MTKKQYLEIKFKLHKRHCTERGGGGMRCSMAGGGGGGGGGAGPRGAAGGGGGHLKYPGPPPTLPTPPPPDLRSGHLKGWSCHSATSLGVEKSHVATHACE